MLTATASTADGPAREDGARLLVACRHAEQIIAAERIASQAQSDALLCIGFIEGIIWGHGWKSWRTGDDMVFCPPDGFGFREAVPAVVFCLEEHPERLIQRAHLLVSSALSSSFLCNQ